MKTGKFIQNNVIYLYHSQEKKKKQYYANLNEKDINGNRKFWHTVKPFFSKKIKSRESVTLTEKRKQFLKKIK